MDEVRNDLPTGEETQVQPEPQPVKPQWQQTKEGWYDKVPLTVKQLDWIIGLGIAGLVIMAIIIGLDAAGVF